MSFQQRTLIALALCALVYLISDFFLPKPEPAPEEEAIATESVDGKTSEDKSADGKATPPEAEAEAPAPEAETAKVAAVDHVLRNDLLELTLTNRAPMRGGIVSGVQLLAPQFANQTTGTDALQLGGSTTLEVSFADEASEVKIPKSATFAVVESSDRHIVMEYAGKDVTVRERFDLLDGYEGRLTVTIVNRETGAEAARDHRLHLGMHVGVSDSQYDISRALCRTSEDLEYEDTSDLDEGENPHFSGGVRWGGADNKYFGLYAVPNEALAACDMKMEEGRLISRLSGAVETLAGGESREYVFGVYLGPKELERLRDFSAVQVSELALEDAIDWGFFGGLSEALGRMLLAMLRWFYALTHSWGISIVLLTIVVKAVTLPLTLKQMSSMKRMRAIQPEIQKIKEKYGSDRVKQGQEMQALFARSGVNPLAGCLPTLVQLPIWFALYSMLSAAVELVHQTFLWLPDLTKQDPYYILPLALGALMVLQNRMMPNTMDEAQAKMMRWLMPGMFTLFMLFLPSGLAVYIFANIVLSLIQTAIQVGFKDEPKPEAKPS
jgi:YidC/Oxa1 family membrane protein insertase